MTLSKSQIKAFTGHKDGSLSVNLPTLPNSIKKEHKTEGTFARADKPLCHILAHFLLLKLYYDRMIQALVSRCKFVKKLHAIVSIHKLIIAFAIFHCTRAIGTHKVSVWQHPPACAKSEQHLAVESTVCYRWCCAYQKVQILSLLLLYKPEVTKIHLTLVFSKLSYTLCMFSLLV